MKPSLLDVNVLLALAWPNHQHHAQAHRWFSREARHGWATISLTQLGFVRLSSNPAYTPHATSPGEAASLLAHLLADQYHLFWHSPSAADPVVYENAIGHQQVKDAYLVEVARQNKGRLLTFDQRLKAHGQSTDLVHVMQTDPTSS